MLSFARFLALLLLANTATAAPVASTASIAIFSTVGHSEWCPAGTVYLDLRTGRYSLMPPVRRPKCNDAGLDLRMQQGVLGGPKLRAIRQAEAAVESDGMTLQACRDGRGAPNIVVSNGGNVTLVLSRAARMEAAPEDQGCWTEAAEKLHLAMESAFGKAR